jgi:hypothetical protein
LSVDELDCDALIARLAGPLSPPDRIVFRRTAEDALARAGPCRGESAVCRAVAAVQRTFFDPPPSTVRAEIGQERSSRLKSAPPIARARQQAILLNPALSNRGHLLGRK